MKTNDRHIAVIQARMGSSRLPGKTMAYISGKPLLWHILERLKKSAYLTEIIIATTRSKENDVLEELSQNECIEIIRGHETNVFSRFEKAFSKYNPDTMTRICGDCPLVDPSFIDRSIQKISEQNVDYLEYDTKQVIHQGTEIISNNCFKKIQAFKLNPIVQEHITPLIYENANMFKIGKLKLQNYEKINGIRLSVDTKSDLEFIQAVYDESKKNPGELSLKQALRVIRDNPNLLKINRHVVQKNAIQKTEFVFLRYRDSEGIQLLDLANYYSEVKGMGVKFLTIAQECSNIETLKRHGFKVIALDTVEEISNFIFQEKPQIIYSSLDDVFPKHSCDYEYKYEKKYKLYRFIRC